MTTLNLRGGDDLRHKLGPAGFAGDYLSVVDPLCQGPIPAGADDQRHLDLRADFVAAAYRIDRAAVRARQAAELAALDALERYQRIVLWFEHDWYDQAILARVLSRLAPRAHLHARLVLVEIDRFPGVERFIGLGQLDPDQLRELAGRERPVTAEDHALASRAWTALAADTPLELHAIASEVPPGLPFLPRALIRHLQELPWVGSGLSLSERLALDALAAGRATFGEAFAFHQAHDPLPYLGDTMFGWIVDRLAPLITRDGAALALTKDGQAVREGRVPWRGQARWVGGVVVGPDPGWRWEPVRAAPVRA